LAIGRGHEIVAKIDIDNASDLNSLTSDDVDVAIEFSNPASAFSNIMTCIKKQIPVVCGTTG
jgi:4-hydroxy-tetrahydrodipicolinate reductase